MARSKEMASASQRLWTFSSGDLQICLTERCGRRVQSPLMQKIFESSEACRNMQNLSSLYWGDTLLSHVSSLSGSHSHQTTSCSKQESPAFWNTSNDSFHPQQNYRMLHVFSLSFHTDVNRYMWCVYKHIDEPTQEGKGRTENKATKKRKEKKRIGKKRTEKEREGKEEKKTERKGQLSKKGIWTLLEPSGTTSAWIANLPQDMMWHGWKHELLCCTFV